MGLAVDALHMPLGIGLRPSRRTRNRLLDGSIRSIYRLGSDRSRSTLRGTASPVVIHVYQVQRAFHRIHNAVSIAVQLVEPFLRNLLFPWINLAIMVPIQARNHSLRSLEHPRVVAFQSIREILGNRLLAPVRFGESLRARARLLLLNG